MLLILPGREELRVTYGRSRLWPRAPLTWQEGGSAVAGKQAEAIAEGVAIAVAAARLAMKNHILVDTIALDESFDPTHMADAARRILADLADEADAAADRLKQQGRKAWGRHSQSVGTHDYRDRDVRNLRRRRRQSEGVAVKLRKMMDDDAQLAEMIEDAREAAWSDVSANLDRTLRVEAMRPDADPDYDTMRDARMQALMLVDLQALEAQVKARKRAAKRS